MNNISKTKPTTKYDSAIIKDIQKQLNLLGFGPLNVDGLFGNFTKHALKAY